MSVIHFHTDELLRNDLIHRVAIAAFTLGNDSISSCWNHSDLLRVSINAFTLGNDSISSCSDEGMKP